MFSWSTTKFSNQTAQELCGRQKGELLINEVSGVKGLTSFLEFCFIMQRMTLSGKLNINITYLM